MANPLFDHREFQYTRGPQSVDDKTMEDNWCLKAFGCCKPVDKNGKQVCGNYACSHHGEELDGRGRPKN